MQRHDELADVLVPLTTLGFDQDSSTAADKFHRRLSCAVCLGVVRSSLVLIDAVLSVVDLLGDVTHEI